MSRDSSSVSGSTGRGTDVRQTRRQEPVRRSAEPDSTQSYAFRRSRTITGSAAASVRAAGEERGQLRSPRLHEHSLRKHRRKLSVYFLAVIAASGLLWYVISSYVTTVSVATNTTQPTRLAPDSARYQQLVETYFRNHPFEQFRFSLNEAGFERYLKSEAPELSSAQLTDGSGGIGSASLVVGLREPVVAWTIKNQQYFVDADGVAYTTNYFAVPSVVVTDKSGVSADAGVVASGKLLRFIGRVITLVNDSGVAQVEAVELPTNSTRQVDFRLTGKPYPIKAHLDRDPAGQAADIVSAVRYVESKAIQPEYLDVRVAAKAYYRDVR